MTTRQSPGSRLRALIGGGSTVGAGCFDALSARLAERAGFEALHVTGFGVEATMLAAPDMGLVTLTELAQHVAHITAAVNVPVICDVDSGFGGIENIFRTIRTMERAGVAAVHIEDVGAPKRNPFVPGRAVISREEAAGRIKAACDARTDRDFVIIGRSDADEVSVAELVERCNLYLAAGADVAMPVISKINGLSIWAIPPDEQLDWHQRIVKSIDGPTLGMIVPEGYAPQDMLKAGYAMMILPMVSLIPAVKAMWSALSAAAPKADPNTSPIESVPDLLTMLEIGKFIEQQERYMPHIGRR